MNECSFSEDLSQLIDVRMTEYIESPIFTEKIPKLIPVYINSGNTQN